MLACCRKGHVIARASFYVEHMGNDFPALEQHVPWSPRHNSPVFLRHPRSTEGHAMVRAASFPWDETGWGLPPSWLPSSPGHVWAATHQARPPLEPERTVPWGYFPSLKEDGKDVWPWGSRSVSQQQSYLFFWFFYTNLQWHTHPWGRAEDSVCATEAKVIVLSPLSISFVLTVGLQLQFSFQLDCFQRSFQHHRKAQASDRGWSRIHPLALGVINGFLYVTRRQVKWPLSHPPSVKFSLTLEHRGTWGEYSISWGVPELPPMILHGEPFVLFVCGFCFHMFLMDCRKAFPLYKKIVSLC